MQKILIEAEAIGRAMMGLLTLFWTAEVATEFFKTFEKFPPRQKPEKWNLSEVMERIQPKSVNK